MATTTPAKFKVPWWLIVLLILIIVAVGFLLANWDKVKAYMKNSNAKPPAPGQVPAAGQPPVSLTKDTKTGRPLNWNVILTKGSEGGEVEALQYMLNTRFGLNLAQDGQFGDKTSNALYNATGKYSITLTNFYNTYYSDNSEGSELSFFNQNFQLMEAKTNPNPFAEWGWGN